MSSKILFFFPFLVPIIGGLMYTPPVKQEALQPLPEYVSSSSSSSSETIPVVEPVVAPEVKQEMVELSAEVKTLVLDINTKQQDWATTIDQYISKFNPNISNQGCGTITGQDWVNAGLKYGNHPYFLVAIARADTSLGKGLTNQCNLGNTGHCDSCRKGNQYNGFVQSVNSISQTLSNKYLGKGTLSCHFSRGGWKKCPEGKTINSGKFYASSLYNWDRNVTDTLQELFSNSQQFYNVKI